ncbi:PepSY domain-containing protein [Luteolibacter sp. Populi]|uniref:PepSY-associated TM helix domain-containing protein n=1 Tax=Luteolibacter sp. Populi TaxID=3230487 RepID=UPI0034662E41
MIPWLTKKRLFAFHGWLGLTLGLPLFIICLSGSFAVMSPEIDRLIEPAMTVTPPPDPAARPLSWTRLVDLTEQACPGGEVAFLDAAAERNSAWQATIAYSPADQRLVYLDPFTGRVQGQTTTFNARGFFRIFHKQLYILSGDFWPHGRVIVCVFSIVLLLSALTGLMFFKGWWKALLRLRIGKGKRAFWSDLHRFAGVWSFLLAILFAVTGFWYLLVRLMEDFGIADHDPLPRIPAEVSAARPPLLQRLSLDELAKRAEQAFPEFKIRAVATGTAPASAVAFYGEGPAILAGEMANQVHLDPFSGEILMLEKAHELPPTARLAEMSYPLHFGRFGGYATKIIWTVAGLSISAGIFAGTVIWWLRSKREDAGFFRHNRKWSITALGPESRHHQPRRGLHLRLHPRADPRFRPYRPAAFARQFRRRPLAGRGLPKRAGLQLPLPGRFQPWPCLRLDRRCAAPRQPPTAQRLAALAVHFSPQPGRPPASGDRSHGRQHSHRHLCPAFRLQHPPEPATATGRFHCPPARGRRLPGAAAGPRRHLARPHPVSGP